MFGVPSDPASLAVAAAQNVGRRAGDLKDRLRSAFLADLPRRRAELEEALAARDAVGELDVDGQRIVASITVEAAKELGLEEGTAVTAVIKASDVMLAID